MADAPDAETESERDFVRRIVEVRRFGDLKAADELGETAILHFANRASATLLLTHADTAIDARQWPTALNRLQHLRDRYPDDERSYTRGITTLRRFGDLKAADELGETAILHFANRASATLLLTHADTAIDARQWPTALNRLQHLRDRYPDDERLRGRALRLEEATGQQTALIPTIRNKTANTSPPIDQYRKSQEIIAETKFRLVSASKGAKKRPLTVFVSMGGFRENVKYGFLAAHHLSREQGDFEVLWLASSRGEASALTRAGLPSVHGLGDVGTLDLLLRARTSVWSTHWSIGRGLDYRHFALSGSVKVQLWHGTPAKSIAYQSGIISQSASTFAAFADDAATTDHVISESEDAVPLYEAAFPFSTITTLGSCRMDGVLWRESITQELLDLGQPSHVVSAMNDAVQHGKRVVLYAPTYRDGLYWRERFVRKLNVDLARLCSNHEWLVVFKPHPAIRTLNGIDAEIDLDLPASCVFVRGGIDSYPLLGKADCLVTDYSSIYYDYIPLDRPIIFVRSDIDDYSRARTIQTHPLEANQYVGTVVTDENAAIDLNRALQDDVHFKSFRSSLAKHVHGPSMAAPTSPRFANWLRQLTLD